MVLSFDLLSEHFLLRMPEASLLRGLVLVQSNCSGSQTKLEEIIRMQQLIMQLTTQSQDELWPRATAPAQPQSLMRSALAISYYTRDFRNKE